MTVNDIKQILDCEVITGEPYLSQEVHTACSFT